MAVGPDGPVELYNTTSRNLGHGVRATLRAGSLVADDVGSGEGVGLYKAIVEVLGIPANVLGDLTAVLLGVVVVELEALGVDTVDGDTGDSTVGGGRGSKSRDGAEGGDGLVHVD